MKSALLATLMLAITATPSLAEKKILEIVKLDGSVQAVTDEDFKTIGEVTIETQLIGDDMQEQIHKVAGPRMRDVLEHFSIDGQVVDAVALDAYRVDIPLSDVQKYDVVLATTIDGKRLSVRDRGPIWIVYPIKDHPELLTPAYEGRSVWQLKELRMK